MLAGNPGTMLRALLATFALCSLLSPVVQARGLVADLSNHLVAITTAFTGADVLLFGTLEPAKGDVVVLVFGPTENVRVRRKSRIGPFWFNTDEMLFRKVPTFYAVASSKPLDLLASDEVLARYQIGTQHLRLEAVPERHRTEADRAAFRAALVRNMQRRGLYTREVLPVRFPGNSLFRTTLHFPANVPPGIYKVETLQFRDGQLENAQSNVLVVSKVGLEADLFDLAQRRPVLYGVGSILVALGAGWTANFLFRSR